METRQRFNGKLGLRKLVFLSCAVSSFFSRNYLEAKNLLNKKSFDMLFFITINEISIMLPQIIQLCFTISQACLDDNKS